MPQWEHLWVNANLATMATPIPSLGLIQNAAIAVNNGRIAWIGSMDDLPTPHDHLAHTFTDVKMDYAWANRLSYPLDIRWTAI